MDIVSSAEDVVVKAVRNAAKRANPGIEKLLEIHLRNTTNSGLELAYRDPKRFKECVSKLFGEYSNRLLEILIIKEIKDILGIKEEINTLEEAVELLRGLI